MAFSESINALAARKPAIRRQLQGAWDLAYSWMALEPHSHHVAMPPVVLMAVLTRAVYGAGVPRLALAWRVWLRIGEAVFATRSCLVLLRDTLGSQEFILLRILEPKTRYRAARHQAAKLEQAHLVQLIDLLWPFTPQTLRKRLDSTLERLGIPTARVVRRPLDLGLGSFRPGETTHLLQMTEDSEFVRRRGSKVDIQ